MGIFDFFKDGKQNKSSQSFVSGSGVGKDTCFSEISEYRAWYRGDAGELSNYFNEALNLNAADGTRFWRRCGQGNNVRKMHSGLPFLMVDKLAQIVTSDFLNVSFDPENKGLRNIWEKIAGENNFDILFYKAITDTLVTGDGAFKISVDTALSGLPIIEWVPSEKVSYHYDRGRLQAAEFFTYYDEYTLTERYEPGRIISQLFKKDKKVSLGSIPQTAKLSEEILYPGGFLMAVPCRFAENPVFTGRGVSVYHTKGYLFDGLDEVFSQWLDAVRLSRVKTYIPESLLPRNPLTGRISGRNAFDDAVIIADDMKEGAENIIRTEQARIDYLAFQTSYNICVDACLQGVLSPATLGIDVKKLDNAESQREKEKTTLSTRAKITGALSEILPRLITISLKVYSIMQGEIPGDYRVGVRFGGYANPSFENMVDTVSKAFASRILSEERIVEYLYGDTLSPQQKIEEIERLKQLNS